MSVENYHKKLFFIAALWNWAAALTFLLLTLLNSEMLNWYFNVIPPSYFWFYLFLASVAIFGLGYYWISKDHRTNQDLTKLGVLGKVIVFAFFVYGYATGIITILLLLAGVVDLIFAALFIKNLQNIKKIA